MYNKETFTQQYMPLASSVGERLNVDPNLLLAQWGLETGWGKSVIPGTNNLGNIKDFSGNGVAATDNMTGSRDKYVKFDTPEAFGDHYVGLMSRRYPKVAGTGSDAEAFAQALKAGGYAEDPNYVNKLVATATGMPMAPTQPQGTKAMNTPNVALPNARQMYNAEDPASVYQFIMSNQTDVPLQQLTPEQKEMLMDSRMQRQSMLPLAIGASLAGDKRVSALGSALAKDAMEARGPQRLGDSGWLTEDGTLIKNPFNEERDLQERQNRALNLAISSANTQALRRLSTENTFTQAGRTPDGKPVVSNKTGQTYVLDSGPNGPSYTPYSQNIIPTGTYDKNVQTVQDALGSVKRSDAILSQVEKTPEAFGLVAQGVSKLPQFAQGRAADLLLSPEVMKTRTDVLRQAAAEINQLYGAALSLGEQARANTFIPNTDDPPHVVIQKLKAARDWAHATTQNYGTGALKDAQGRSAMPGQQQPGQPAAAQEERKSVGGKNYVKRNGQWYEE